MYFPSKPSKATNPERLKRSDILLLLGIALAVNVLIVALQPVPGYMDAAYYYAGSLRLAGGNGFSEPFLWNYLDPAQSLPHPSHAYWYPLASLVGALGMFVTGRMDFLSARIFFLLTAVLFPVAVARLTFHLSGRRALALSAGCLAIFSGYYLPFVVTTDHYAAYMLIGAILFLLVERGTKTSALVLGVLVGLLNLARADGLLWLPLTILSVVVAAARKNNSAAANKQATHAFLPGLLVLAGYLLSMGFWLMRSWLVFGSLTPPGAGHVLWMTDYNQLYSLTPETYTFKTWLASGWQAIVAARLGALWQNLGTALMGQGMILFSPLMAIGAWRTRRCLVTQFGVVGWLSLILIHSFLFPFASVRGGFFHAGAVLQPLWFGLVPIGIETVIKRMKRLKFDRRMKMMLHSLPVLLMIVLSGMLVKIRVIDSGWNEGEYRYLQAEAILVAQGVTAEAIVVTTNPPAYFVMTGRQAIVIPFGEVDDLLEAARQYGATILILERDRALEPISDIAVHPENHPEFREIGGFDEVRIFQIEFP